MFSWGDLGCRGRESYHATYEILPVMSILKVARMGHPVLRARAKPLDPAEITGEAAEAFGGPVETAVENKEFAV